MTPPTFTIVMPCHDAAGTVDAAIDAVRAQTRTDWELVCVDDGSGDATPAILEAWCRADPRIRVLRQANAGPSVARNRGALAARGRILAFLDADDLWLPGKLAAVDAAMAGAEACFGRVVFFDGAADAGMSAAWDGPLAPSDCLGTNPLCTLSNLSVRRDAFLATGGFDPGLRHAEDLAWLIGAVSGGLRVLGLPEPHLRYRTSAEGLSSDLEAMHAGWRRAVARAAAALPEAELRRAEARHLRYLARRALRLETGAATARALALRGLRQAPIAFLGGGHRGAVTLAACLAAPLLPVPLRRRAFA